MAQKTLRGLLALFFFVSVGTVPARSDNPVIKFARGTENIVTSPLEFPVQYAYLGEGDRTVIVTAIAGTAYGFFWTLARIGAGAYEVATFPIPLPWRYKPLMKPPTPWEAFKTRPPK